MDEFKNDVKILQAFVLAFVDCFFFQISRRYELVCKKELEKEN